ncbi:hypothetical protein [Streptomyces niveus]|uniref:hypothetical protein n=1 Tax=Streptomyces niveus TaxID=193462 RepID=UPI0038658F38
MAYRSRYTGRYTGLGKIINMPGMQARCIAAAEEMKAVAEAISPVGDPRVDDHAGQYKASFVVVPHTKNVPWRGRPKMRDGARLLNTAPHAAAVEFGNGKVPRYSVLSNAREIVEAAHA